MKYVIFGAGDYGTQALEFLGKKNVKFYIDNNIEKQNKYYNNIRVLGLNDAIEKITTEKIILAVSSKYIEEIKKQLLQNNIKEFMTFSEIKHEYTKEKILKRTDYLEIYNRAIKWIYRYTIPNHGIINNTGLKQGYPEVTGYFIPTLLKWGHKELAIQYAKWLCEIQHDNGAWYDTENNIPYVFDSAQVLKGLIAVRHLYPKVDVHIKSGCDWLISNVTNDGRLKAYRDDEWGDGKSYSELIHVYCISPIREAGILFNNAHYIEVADKIALYYTTKYKEHILKFDLLSHFYAYVMEAMIDIGKTELAKEAMKKMEAFQNEDGAVPAYNNVNWVCSTGLFQLAIVWFRLGDFEHGNKAFTYACKLQNESGGWYGSYLVSENTKEINNYFPNAEISWAVKYFLDALYYKNICQFEQQSGIFCSNIEKKDGRYQCVSDIVKSLGDSSKILDMGCGKGRYLKNLIQDYPSNEYYAGDISLSVMEYIDIKEVKKVQSNLTNICFADDEFDMVYTCEALEHAVDIQSAIRELCRVVKPGGKVVIIDKNILMLGYFEIEEWEQWFDENELKEELLKYCSDVYVEKEIAFDNVKANGLFYCWIGTVKESRC